MSIPSIRKFSGAFHFREVMDLTVKTTIEPLFSEWRKPLAAKLHSCLSGTKNTREGRFKINASLIYQAPLLYGASVKRTKRKGRKGKAGFNQGVLGSFMVIGVLSSESSELQEIFLHAFQSR